MDTLYIGDIPSEYHYAQFGSNYVDLYNAPSFTGTVTYYRVYFYDNYFNYEIAQRNYSYSTGTARDIPVSSDWWYRRDVDSIFVMCFIFTFFAIFVTNLFTSIVRKGGVFGGLV